MTAILFKKNLKPLSYSLQYLEAIRTHSASEQGSQHVITASSSGCAPPPGRRKGQRSQHAPISMYEDMTSRLVCHFLDRLPPLSLVNEPPLPGSGHESYLLPRSLPIWKFLRILSWKNRSEGVPSMLAMPLAWCSPY